MPPGKNEAQRPATVVAFHGPGTTPALYEKLQELLPGVPVVVPDLNAHADAVGPSPDAVSHRIAEALAGAEPLIFVATTYASKVALLVARLIESRVRAILLATPTPLVEDEATITFLQGLRQFVTAARDPEMRESFAYTVIDRRVPGHLQQREDLIRMLAESTSHQRGGLAALSQYPQRSCRDLIEGLAASLEIFTSRDDVYATPEWMEPWRVLAGEGRFHYVEGSAHFIALQRPDVLVEAIRRYL